METRARVKGEGIETKTGTVNTILFPEANSITENKTGAFPQKGKRQNYFGTAKQGEKVTPATDNRKDFFYF
jgi:hypothetical protein